jgi:hypothetical protein
MVHTENAAATMVATIRVTFIDSFLLVLMSSARGAAFDPLTGARLEEFAGKPRATAHPRGLPHK